MTPGPRRPAGRGTGHGVGRNAQHGAQHGTWGLVQGTGHGHAQGAGDGGSERCRAPSPARGASSHRLCWWPSCCNAAPGAPGGKVPRAYCSRKCFKERNVLHLFKRIYKNAFKWKHFPWGKIKKKAWCGRAEQPCPGTRGLAGASRGGCSVPCSGLPGWLSTAGASPPRRLPCGTELSPAASQKPFPGLHGVTSPS